MPTPLILPTTSCATTRSLEFSSILLCFFLVGAGAHLKGFSGHFFHFSSFPSFFETLAPGRCSLCVRGSDNTYTHARNTPRLQTRRTEEGVFVWCVFEGEASDQVWTLRRVSLCSSYITGERWHHQCLCVRAVHVGCGLKKVHGQISVCDLQSEQITCLVHWLCALRLGFRVCVCVCTIVISRVPVSILPRVGVLWVMWVWLQRSSTTKHTHTHIHIHTHMRTCTYTYMQSADAECVLCVCVCARSSVWNVCRRGSAYLALAFFLFACIFFHTLFYICVFPCT